MWLNTWNFLICIMTLSLVLLYGLNFCDFVFQQLNSSREGQMNVQFHVQTLMLFIKCESAIRHNQIIVFPKIFAQNETLGPA